MLQCKDQDVKVTWQPATAPYNLLIVSADDPCGDALYVYFFSIASKVWALTIF
jgi:hypothetical protein